jgi:hypothetical protein
MNRIVNPVMHNNFSPGSILGAGLDRGLFGQKREKPPAPSMEGVHSYLT